MAHFEPLSNVRPGLYHTISSCPKQKRQNTDADIKNYAPVARIMKGALPDNAKIAKEAKECMQECVSEFISFITSEGMTNKPLHILCSCAILTITCSVREMPAGETQDR